jgi:prolyl-tRNA editing enzyme YbaK/EbsC (Cys-tRNA(Pro) deacylase)
MTEDPPASIALRDLGIPHRVFRHAGKVTSLEQAAQERGERPGQVVRSIVFRLGEDEFLMALVAGPAQISWRRLRQHVGRSRLTMASEAEVLEHTGYRIGTVSPFGLPGPWRILIDPGVLAEAEISIGSGFPSTGIVLASADLRRGLPKAEIVPLVEGA